MRTKTWIKRKCRETGHFVILAAPGIEADVDEGWLTICDKHSSVCSHETRKLAEGWLSHPLHWCGGCQKENQKNK